ncbi:MAG: DUF1446 domain-containing protein [Firmicutes bacterium]|nr:DUF1446 domain-containing protein [Bacillota bacterium]
MKKLTVLSPTAILGYGFPRESFAAALAHDPDIIGVDAGSVDPGPYYLGAGVSFTDRAAVKRDLALLLPEALKRGIPLLIGTAGGSGAHEHLAWNREIIEEIAAEQNLSFKMAVIPADIDKDHLLANLNKTVPLGPLPPLTARDVREATYIVAQMGWEPYKEALDMGAQVILGGRTYDPAVFAALALKLGFPKGPALHMGKILECAAIAAEPGSGRDCMIGVLDEEGFTLFPTNPQRRCTVKSVAAHSLYEKSNPWLLPGPGGALDLRHTLYRQVSDNAVRVTGSEYVESDYAIKMEGARLVGYRTLTIAGVRDPIFISQLEDVLEQVRSAVRDNFEDNSNYSLDFKIYGLNGVMGKLEPNPVPGHEVGIIIEAVAGTQEQANTICSFCRTTLLHYGYEGRIATAGNLALPYSPSDLPAGAVYEYCIHHLLPATPDFFKPEIVEVG